MKTRVTWKDIAAAHAANEGGRDGLMNAAEAILDASNQVVPFESGELMGTGAVDFDTGEMTAHVLYDTVYAARLHQNPKFNFQNGRRGKFLKSAAQGAARYAEELIGEGLKGRFRRAT